jgi:di/tricarboxylate transporter
LGKLLVLLGLTLVVIGGAMQFGLPLGRLPGDITLRRGNVTFYFPLATGILVSLVLTLVVSLVRR